MLAEGRDELTFAALHGLTRSIRGDLAEAGWGSSWRIGIVMPGGVCTATTILGVMACATAVPLNPEYTRSELTDLLLRMRVQALVADPESTTAVEAARALGLPVLIARSVGREAGVVRLVGLGSEPGAAPLGEEGSRPDVEAPAPSPARVALVLHTSGSTAAPKIVPLTERNLIASAENVARSLALTGEDLCLSTMPLFHIGALVDLLLAPLSVGGRVVVAPAMTASDFFTHMRRFSPTWYQGVPTMLHALLRSVRAEGGERPGGTLRFIRSVSSPLGADMLAEVERTFGVPVIEIYGMTETAGVITSNPLPPGERRPGSVGLPAGPEVTVVDGAGNPVPAGVRGEVVVRGESVTAGYEGDDRRETFLGPWLRTGDEGLRDADGYLYLTGRIKEIINRGGEKIAPREIDTVVEAHPSVLEAAAFAQAHESLGEDVAVAVVASVPSSEWPRLEAEIVSLCRDRLADFKVPRRVVFLDELPRAPGGKLRRGALPTATERVAGGGEEAPEEWTERRLLLAGLWRDVLEVDRIALDDDFFDLGGDSLSAAEFVEAFRAETETELPPAALFDHPTIARLDEALEELAPSPTGPGAPAERAPAPSPPASREVDAVIDEVRGFLTAWMGRRPETDALLVGWNTLGERPPLFFGVQGFGELSDFAGALGADQPVYGMRSLYEARTKSPENLARLAAHYADEIERLRPTGPIDLGGYCAGGRLAHLVGVELRARRRTVRSLSLLEHAPERPWAGPIDLHFHVDSGFHSFSDATRGWLDGLTGPVRLHPTHADHQAIITDPRTATALSETLAGHGAKTRVADAVRAPGADPGGRIRVKLDAPRTAVSRTTVSVVARLANEAPTPLESDSVLFLRWGRPGSTRQVLDTTGALPDALAPGGAVELPLRARVPLAPGRWHLHAEVVEAGDWSRPRIPTGPPHRLLVLPGPAVVGYVARRLPGRSIWSRP